MNDRARAAARRILSVLLAADAAAGSGCIVFKAVTTPVKVAATTVVVTGETAGAAVKATGKVAVSAFDAVGSVGSGGIDAAARLAQVGMVTFVDVSTGRVSRVPWRAGFTIASAGTEARVQLARRVIEVVRGGVVVLSSRYATDSAAPLVAGDVVRIRG